MSSHQRNVESRRSYELIADRITALIEAEGLAEGARLPALRDLALQFGVSRQTLREALIALEMDGRVEIRGKSGVFVCSSVRRCEISAVSVGGSPAEILQARLVLESAMTLLAAARASSLGLQRIEDALEEMRERVSRGYSPVEAERRFHVSIAEQSANSVLVQIVGALFDAWRDAIEPNTGERVETAQSWRCALDERGSILRALRTRLPQAAAAEMCLHLQSSYERWIRETLPIASSSTGSARRNHVGFRTAGDRPVAVRLNLFPPNDSAKNHSLADFGVKPLATGPGCSQQTQPELSPVLKAHALGRAQVASSSAWTGRMLDCIGPTFQRWAEVDGLAPVIKQSGLGLFHSSLVRSLTEPNSN